MKAEDVSGCAPDAESDGSPVRSQGRRYRKQEHMEEREQDCNVSYGMDKKEGQPGWLPFFGLKPVKRSATRAM